MKGWSYCIKAGGNFPGTTRSPAQRKNGNRPIVCWRVCNFVVTNLQLLRKAGDRPGYAGFRPQTAGDGPCTEVYRQTFFWDSEYTTMRRKKKKRLRLPAKIGYEKRTFVTFVKSAGFPTARTSTVC
jgi:hypothetical protein